MNLKNP